MAFRYWNPWSLDAGDFPARTITDRQGLSVGSPDEVAYKLKWISKKKILKDSIKMGKFHGNYLMQLAHSNY